jgi:hypothetical protein
MGFKDVCPGSRKIQLETSDVPGSAKSYIYRISDNAMNVMTLLLWEEASIGLGRHSTSQIQEGLGKRKEDCKLVIVENGKDEEGICKEKSVSELSDSILLFVLLLLLLSSSFHFYTCL